MVNWNSNLETGIEVIDNQHKELVEKVNELLEAGKNRRAKEEIESMLDFLEKYVVDHFATEEESMLKYDYPRYQEHKQIHQDFIQEVSELKAVYQERGAKLDLVITLNSKVVKWLINHIMGVDKQLAKFLIENK